MRERDYSKETRILDETLHLINSQGLSNISMSKIAKAANGSPATIYIYFENKEDLINSLYIKTKTKMSTSIFESLSDTNNIKVQYEQVVTKFIQFMMNYKEEFLFLEQVQNSPMLKESTLRDSDELFSKLANLYVDGKNQGILKDRDIRLLSLMTSRPAMEYAKLFHKGQVEGAQEEIKYIVKMCWDASSKK